MNGRISRLWYLPKEWDKISTAKPVAEYLGKPEPLQIATSWPDDQTHNWEQIEKTCPTICLSRSPLTFGHSQLIIPSPSDTEQDLFHLASKIIYNVILTFTSAFGNTSNKPLHEDNAFEALAESTHTYGSYNKTLVIRASANEKSDPRQYKVHLIPYFTSHELLCRKRFQSVHTVKDDRTGGLIGWLGERETIADKWEVCPSPIKPLLDVVANNYFGMINLAAKLRAIWPGAGDQL